MPRPVVWQLVFVTGALVVGLLAPTAGEESPLQTYREWLIRNGFAFDKIDFAVFADEGRGVVAKCDMEEGDIILSVGPHLLLTIDVALASPVGPLLRDLPGQLALQTFLIYERTKPDSFWAPYFAVVPESFDTLLDFTEEELEELQDLPIKTFVQQRKIKLVKNYEWIKKELLDPKSVFFPPEVYTPEAYAWAATVIRSRAWEFKTSNGYQTTCAPGIDMLNHRCDAPLAYLDNDGSVVLRASRPIKAGEQIFLSYGRQSNQDLLEKFGFVVEENEFDCVHVALFNTSGESPDLTRSIVPQLLKNVRTFRIERGTMCVRVNGDLALFLKYLVMASALRVENATDIQRCVAGAYGRFVNSLEDRLKRYSTTLEEDRRLLARNENTSPHLRMAILTRIGVKETTRRLIETIRDLDHAVGLHRVIVQPETLSTSTLDDHQRPDACDGTFPRIL